MQKISSYYLIFGTGHAEHKKPGYAEYDLRLTIRDYINRTLKKIGVIPEEIQEMNSYEEQLAYLQEIGIKEKLTAKQIQDTIEFLEILIKNSELTFILHTSTGPIAEFAEYYRKDDTKKKLVVFIPIEYMDEDSLPAAQIQRFIFGESGKGYYYRDIEDLKFYIRKYIFYTKDRISYDFDSINSEYQKWKKDKLEDNILNYYRYPESYVSLYDPILVGIVPKNYPNDLTDPTGKVNDRLVDYFKKNRLLISQDQPINVQEFLQFTNYKGDEITIHPDGKIFFYLGYITLNKAKVYTNMKRLHKNFQYIWEYYIFYPELLFHSRNKARNLEHYLKKICEIFLPDRDLISSKNFTENFTGIFTFPLMIHEEKPRVLYEDKVIPIIPKIYSVKKPEIEITKDFSYSEIVDLCKEIENLVGDYFNSAKPKYE